MFPRLYHKWSADGQQSIDEKDWKYAQVDISEAFDYEVVFRGIRGDEFYSDIAVDDIVASPSPCRKSVAQRSFSSLVGFAQIAIRNLITVIAGGHDSHLNL